MYGQQQFSDEVVLKGDHYFMPFTKGEWTTRISSPFKNEMERIKEIISSWSGVNPPKGFKVDFYGDDKRLEITFAAYVKEDGERCVRTGADISIYINTPSEMFSIEVVDGIYIKPEKSGDFHGFQKISSKGFESVVITKEKMPLYMPVTREEYLKAMIVKADKEYPASERLDRSQVEKQVAEMEVAYRKLLEVDKTAAEEVRKGIDEIRKEVKAMSHDTADDYPSILRRELEHLSTKEKALPAFISTAAAEMYGSAAGLVPENMNQMADQLVKVNPEIEKLCSNNTVNMLILHMRYEAGEDGFHLADKKIRELLGNADIWKLILEGV